MNNIPVENNIFNNESDEESINHDVALENNTVENNETQESIIYMGPEETETDITKINNETSNETILENATEIENFSV